MSRFVFAAIIVASFGTATAAGAVTITNLDTEERILTVTENGVRSEIVIGPKAKISTCENGCFVSFPAGDIMVFKGKEDVAVEGGKGRLIKN